MVYGCLRAPVKCASASEAISQMTVLGQGLQGRLPAARPKSALVPKTDLIPKLKTAAHASRLCNRAEELAKQDQVNATSEPKRVPSNKGKLTGAKPPLRPKHVWSIRTKLQIDGRVRDLAMFNLAIDSKLRSCDVVAIRVEDIAAGGHTADRATVRQKKTGRPVRFELSEQTRRASAALDWTRDCSGHTRCDAQRRR